MTTKPVNPPTYGQISHFFRLVEEGLVTGENFQGFLEKPDQFLRTKFPVLVNYGFNLVEMIERGKYDWKNDEITPKNFKIEGSGEIPVDLVLVHFGESITTQDVKQRLSDQGLVSAKIEHLLAFGARYPELQRKFPVVALGSGRAFTGRTAVSMGRSASRRGCVGTPGFSYCLKVLM